MKLDRSTMGNTGEYPILKPGTYRFEVMDVTAATSSNGNDMYQLRLKCFQDNGPAVTVWDNLVETERAGWRFIQFFDSIGMDANDTERVKDAISEVGRVRVKVEKDNKGRDRNVVDAYIAAPTTEETAKPSAAAAPAPKKKAPRKPAGILAADTLDDPNADLPF